MNKFIKFEINGLALLLEMESVSVFPRTRTLLSLQGLGNKDFFPAKNRSLKTKTFFSKPRISSQQKRDL